MDRIDLALLGDCDKVIEWIKNELDGNPSHQRPKQLFDKIGHVWALEGANLDHKWIQKVKNFFDDQGSEEEEEEKQEIDSKAEDSVVV